MTELERLYERRIMAVDEFRKLQAKHEIELAEAIGVEKKRLTAEFDAKYSEAIDFAREAAKKAVVAHEAALIADVVANLPFSVGAKMVSWGQKKKRFGRNDNPIEILATGFAEVVKRDTVFPGNISEYHRPEVGDVIVRLAKANGTAGVAFDKYKFGKYRWLPEGVHPDDVKEPVREIKF